MNSTSTKKSDKSQKELCTKQSKTHLNHSAAIIQLLNSWNITAIDQIKLLGLPPRIKARHMQRYQKDEVLPFTDEISERIAHLLGIADALRTSYPHNELMGPLWLKTKHRRFNRKTPLEIMLENSKSGLISVRTHLDCAYDWQQDEEGHNKNIN